MKNKNVFLKLFPFLCVLTLVVGAYLPFAYANIYTFDNPITGPNSNSIADLIKFVIGQLQPLAIIIVSLFILWYGFLYVYYSSQGNESKLKELHGLAPKLLLGAAIVAGASAIIEAVKLFANSIE